MDKKLIEYLEEMNEQEERILRENRPVLSYYTKEEGSTVVDAGITMRPMTLIDLLKQPRFVPLPRHTHNYMELVYMCSGSTTHGDQRGDADHPAGGGAFVPSAGDVSFRQRGRLPRYCGAVYDPAGFSSVSLKHAAGGYGAQEVHPSGLRRMCPGRGISCSSISGRCQRPRTFWKI